MKSAKTALSLVYLCLSNVLASPILGGLLSMVDNKLTDIADDATGTVDVSAGAVTSILDDVDNVLNIITAGLPITDLQVVEAIIGGIEADLTDADEIFATYAGLFQNIVHQSLPTSIPDAIERAASFLGNSTNGVTAENLAQAILAGLAPQEVSFNLLGGSLNPVNSYDNYGNPPSPYTIYPRKAASDAPYSVDETSLRAALYFPTGSTFTSAKQPILFVPGTGSYGGSTYDSNLAKLLSATNLFEPVYLNVPEALLGDAQINAEYVAYAMNYLYALNLNRQIAVIAWSQGNIDTQWAYKYWPSTRETSSDFISASADFHGTVNAYLIAPALPKIPNPPSIYQQEYSSSFITTLRSNGGDSPYVPSTSVYSITDEIVQPQYDPVASASYSGTSSCPNATYTNNEIQSICPSLPAGGLYTHEGMLYNPLMYALALDALTHDGPGQVSRLDLNVVCNQLVPPGLDLQDVLATEGLIVGALVNYLLYPQKVVQEPTIMGYASSGTVVQGCSA